jgi:hypothetical protein
MDVTDIQHLAHVCEVSVDTTVTLLLKAVFVSTEKKGRYSMFRTIKVRDIVGAKHFIRAYGNIRNDIKEGEVYKFSSLLVQQYRKEGEKWGRLRTQSTTKVREVDPEIAMLFSHVTVGDSYVGGILIGHEQIHFYECCANCWKKNFLPENRSGKTLLCKFCASKVDESNPTHDFSVNLVVSDPDGDNLQSVLAFRRHLGFQFNSLNLDQVQIALESKHFHRCSIEYDKDECEGKSVITAQAVSFPTTPNPPSSHVSGDSDEDF